MLVKGEPGKDKEIMKYSVLDILYILLKIQCKLIFQSNNKA